MIILIILSYRPDWTISLIVPEICAEIIINNQLLRDTKL